MDVRGKGIPKMRDKAVEFRKKNSTEPRRARSKKTGGLVGQKKIRQIGVNRIVKGLKGLMREKGLELHQG